MVKKIILNKIIYIKVIYIYNYKIDEHINNINNNGFTIIKNCINSELVEKVIKDFDYWTSLEENKFIKFNYDRVTNFYIYSKNTLDLVTNGYCK